LFSVGGKGRFLNGAWYTQPRRRTIAHISTPLVLGALKDLYGIQAAFYALGVFAFLFSFALPPVHRWSLAGGKPS